MENDANEPTGAAQQNQLPQPISTVKANNTMPMLCHLLALSSLLCIPFGNILGPLIIWLMKRDEDPLVDICGKESLNFQISVTIYGIALCFLLFPALLIPFIGLLLVPVILLAVIGLVIAGIVFPIIAAIQASEGNHYTYPLTIRCIQ